MPIKAGFAPGTTSGAVEIPADLLLLNAPKVHILQANLQVSLQLSN